MDEDDQPYCIDTDIQAHLPGVTEDRVRDLAVAVLRAENCPSAELSIAVVDGPTIRQLNQQYLQHDRQTDVLSFDLAEEASPETDATSVSGQIVVNTDQAARQADARSLDPAAELMLYIVHGCLHLLGYDDHDPAEAERMHRREDALLEQLGYGRVYEQTPGGAEDDHHG